uniref:Putative secreted protein n=1 Tax=Ixodes ricinus TaxID=34613 RepID=A0A6B0TW75_IXORI
MALNISSTLMFSLALVSNSWMPIWSAKRWASSVSTTFRLGSSFLLPTRILLTTSQFCSISCSQRLTLAKDSPLVTS